MTPEEVYEQHLKTWSDIQGHLLLLKNLSKGKVFEIGVRGGVSTAALLVGVHEHGGHVWSLDVINCSQAYDDPSWTFIHGHSVQDAPRILEQLPKELDVFFLDADHTLENTRQELKIYGARVKPGGLILCHDTDLEGAAVREALDEYAKQINRVPVYHINSYGMGELRI